MCKALLSLLIFLILQISQSAKLKSEKNKEFEKSVEDISLKLDRLINDSTYKYYSLKVQSDLNTEHMNKLKKDKMLSVIVQDCYMFQEMRRLDNIIRKYRMWLECAATAVCDCEIMNFTRVEHFEKCIFDRVEGLKTEIAAAELEFQKLSEEILARNSNCVQSCII